MCPGDGPTVETQTYERPEAAKARRVRGTGGWGRVEAESGQAPSWKPKGWTIACSARDTSSTLSAGSPMPMNTCTRRRTALWPREEKGAEGWEAHHIPQRRHAVLPDGGGGGVQLREDLVGGEGAE